jgi:hypothetical protein
MKRSSELLCEILDLMALGKSQTEIARRIACCPVTIYRFIQRSKAGDPEFIVTWSDVEAQFAVHARSAERMSYALIESQARAFALEGFSEPVVFAGELKYAIDPKLVGVPDDMLDILFGVTDRYLRINGEVQPLTVRRKPSDALVLKMLSAHFPKTYADKSSVDVNVGGVLRLQRPDERNAPMKTIEHQPDAEFTLDDGDDAIQSSHGQLAVGRPAIDSAEMDRWNDDGEFAPQPVAFINDAGERDVRIAAPDPLLPVALKETREEKIAREDAADLASVAQVNDRAARAAAENARVAAAVKNPRPQAAPTKLPSALVRPVPPSVSGSHVREDDRMEGVGAGAVRPGGMKVR